MIETTRWNRYFDDVQSDFCEAKRKYPFMKMSDTPTNQPGLIRITAIAVDKKTIDDTLAKEEDFTGEFSKKIVIEVPERYREQGCIVYGAGWVDLNKISEADIHFYRRCKTKNGYRMCVGTPESFLMMKNVILESIKTADAMLVAYEKVMCGISESLDLVAYVHGDAGREQFMSSKAKYIPR